MEWVMREIEMNFMENMQIFLERISRKMMEDEASRTQEE
jgi:hypothetical protein